MKTRYILTSAVLLASATMLASVGASGTGLPGASDAPDTNSPLEAAASRSQSNDGIVDVASEGCCWLQVNIPGEKPGQVEQPIPDDCC